MLNTSMQAPDILQPKDWWYWPPVTSPPTNHKNVHRLITHPIAPLLHPVFKNFPWKPSSTSNYAPCLVPHWAPAVKCSAGHLHFPSPQPGVSRLVLLGWGKWAQVWFNNIVTSNGRAEFSRYSVTVLPALFSCYFPGGSDSKECCLQCR